MTRSEVTIKALTGIKLVEPGDDLGAITVAALAANGLAPQDGDVLVWRRRSFLRPRAGMSMWLP